MEFALTPAQQELKDATARFAEGALNERLRERDAAQEFSREGWRRCAAQGLQGLLAPARYGGGERDPVTATAALEGLGYGCRDNGLWFAINAHMWGCMQPLLAFGSEAQRARHLPGLCDGSRIGALAVSEPEAGSDAYSLRARAERRGDGYVLNGRKVYVTNGPLADLIVLIATVDPSKGAHGLTAFLVEKGAPGLVQGPAVEKMGLRTAAMGELELRDCALGPESRLGGEGAGLALFSHAMEWERGFILACALGSMQRQLELCRRRARERRQFGQPIGAFQQVSGKLVDMHLRLEAARLVQYKLAWLKAEGRRATVESATAKLTVSEAWVRSCEDALQLHGGHGYLSENGIERDLRDALASRIYSGTSEIQRQVIAQWLGAG
jgi:alkylation response protein AidB-like acyl-CoA dehydrogenase